MNKDTQEDQKKPILKWYIYFELLPVAVIAVVVIWSTQGGDASKREELEQLIAEREALQSQADTIEKNTTEIATAEKQTDESRRQLYRMIDQYRALDDFPTNLSKLILASVDTSGDAIRFCLPENKHQLVIEISKIDSKTKKQIEQKQLEYDLPGNARYQVELDLPENNYRNRGKPRQMRLLIESDSDLFPSVAERLFEPVIPVDDTESHGWRVIIAFPNEQKQLPEEDDAEFDLLAQRGLRLAHWQWKFDPSFHKLPDEPPFEISFRFRIVSAGPNVIASKNLIQFITDPKYKLDYLGDGRYAVSEASLPESE